MLYNYPKFYAHNLPEDFSADNLNVLHAIEGSHVETAPWNNLMTLTSLAGQQFLSFAKYTDFGQGWFIIYMILYDSFCTFSAVLNLCNTFLHFSDFYVMYNYSLYVMFIFFHSFFFTASSLKFCLQTDVLLCRLSGKLQTRLLLSFWLSFCQVFSLIHFLFLKF